MDNKFYISRLTWVTEWAPGPEVRMV